MVKKNQEQRAEKVTLKRKLTGPPRLLLGKTRTRMTAEDKPSPKSDTAELIHTANMDLAISSEVNVESSRGRPKAAGEEDDQMKIRNRTVNRRRWWRRFSAAVVCIRKQKKDVEQSLEKQKNDSSVPPEGALQETDTAALNNTDTRENTEKVTKGKRRLNVRTWPMFRRILTSSDIHQTHEQKRIVEKDGGGPSTSLRKELRRFSTREENNRSTGVPLKNMEDTMKCEEAPCSSVAQVDGSGVMVGSLEVVAAEMSIQPTEERDKTPAEEQLVSDVPEEDLTDAVDDSEVVEVSSGTNNIPVEAFVSSERDKVFCVHTEIFLDADNQPSASEVHFEEKKDETTSRSLQSSTNIPSIRIELVPPDGVTQEDEEEECWEGSSSSENRNHRLLLGFQHSEQQLVQTARSLVRAAMNAALDQLTREQQSESDCVHRGPLGCRDHA